MKRTDILSEEIVQKLRQLDPVSGRPRLTTSDLDRAREAVTGRSDASELTRPVMLPGATELSSSHRKRWAAVAVAAAVLVPLGAALAYTLRPAHENGGPAASGAAHAVAIPRQYQDIAAEYAPLSQHLNVDCGGQAVAVPMLAAPGGAESGNSPAAQALRDFFQHNPFAGMGAVTPTDWLVLSQTPKEAIFGQRTGPIGVGTVVVFTRKGGSYTPASETGCSTVHAGPGETAEPITSVSSTGATLTLQWMNESNCGSGPSRTARTTARVAVAENAGLVRVMLLSQPAAGAGPTTTAACGGTAIATTTTVHLKAPLANRQLVDDSRVPSNRLSTKP